MPLIKGFSRKSISKNIGMELKAHPAMSRKQAVAIALSVAKQAKSKSKRK